MYIIFMNTNNSSDNSICFVSPEYYENHFGGSEFAIKHLADYFKKIGWKVSFVSAGNKNDELNFHGQECSVFYYKSHKGFHLLSYLSMKKALKKANAVVYYQSASSVLTFACSRFCKKNRKMMIWSAANDMECKRFWSLKILFLEKRLLGYSLRRKITKIINCFFIDLLRHKGICKADVLIAQNYRQKELIKKSLRRDAVVMYRGYNSKDITNETNLNISTKKIVLWVGNLRRIKRPEVFVSLAKKMIYLDACFIMIGKPYGNILLQRKFEELVADVPCLKYLGSVSHDVVINYMKKSTLLISTSSSEGFPTVFIESWYNKLPVLSFGIDPDNLIEQYGVGVVTKNFNELVNICHEFITGYRKCNDKDFNQIITLFSLDTNGNILRNLIKKTQVRL